MKPITRLFSRSVARSALAVAIATASVQASFAQTSGAPERADVPAEYKWDLTALYATAATW